MTPTTYNGLSDHTNINGKVPLRTGPPTREELLDHYPAKFTWNQLKTFVNSGDLGLIKRDRALQKRYSNWLVGVKEQYGSIENYLMNHRLLWGQPDTLSLLKSSAEDESFSGPVNGITTALEPSTPPAYFSWETPGQYISIIQSDWPYSVPPEIEDKVVWTRVPIYHSDLIAKSILPRIEQDGLWGFTGNDSPPPSPSNLPSCLPALAEWKMTKEKMIKSDPPTAEEALLIERAGSEVARYVKNRWLESDWETAWFVHPPRLQSVPGLAHIHVLARQK